MICSFWFFHRVMHDKVSASHIRFLQDGPIEKDVFALCLAENGGSMTVGGVIPGSNRWKNMEKQECKDSVSDQLISWQLMPLWTRNTTWMPTNEPFQWTPYHAGYYVTLDGIHFRGKELFSDRPLGDFQLDRNLVWSVRAVQMKTCMRSGRPTR